MVTIHGAELYRKWEEAGGTKEGWISKVVPIFQENGAQGPLYILSERSLARILAMATEDAK